MPAEYEITTVADFAKVPDDRIEDCLREFAGLVISHRINLQRPDFNLLLDSWTWIDDGIPMVRGVGIAIGDQHEYFPNPNFPQPE